MLSLHIQKNFRNLEANESNLSRSKNSYTLDQKKILLVGMMESPHFQKWLSVMTQEFPDRTILLFPTDRPRFNRSRFSPSRKGKKSIRIFRLLPNRKLNFIAYYCLDVLFGLKWRAYFLAKVTIKHKPSIIHFHEMQHGAYIFNLIADYRKIPNNSRNIVSTWGSDLTLYSWVDKHQSQIKSCFNWIDILTAEKEIELEDAKRLGYKGEFRAPIYITVGQNFSDNLEKVKPSARKCLVSASHSFGAYPTPNCSQAALSKPRLVISSRPCAAPSDLFNCS
jgi:hypothetical protein